ncbi:MAG: phospho-sugar mutase [Clostridia bacterium]|nr:phospho-sugar mutase [Clostridia bacterium]
MDYKDRLNEWLESPAIDEETKNELRAITDEKELEDRFYRDLEFGTAGLRGIIGAGTNRMNKYVIMKTTKGVSDYINSKNVENPSVAISYDSRRFSKEFAETAALVFAANGIKAYVSDELRPTPVLSFMIRYFKCISGVMLTASHNPAIYNGYKLYWDDGCQIKAPIDEEVMAKVAEGGSYDVEIMDKDEAIEKGLFVYVGKEIDDEYISRIKGERVNPEISDRLGKDISIVYTPLNGCGNKLVRRVLAETGFSNVTVVPEQEMPDGNFPTIPKPNPEYPEVYELGIKLAREKGADVVIATDPDSDRFGMMVRNDKDEYVRFTGNMIGSMLTEYVLSSLKERGELTGNERVIKSIVTTNLIDSICSSYGVKLSATLTGFKHIGSEVSRCEDPAYGKFVFGFEESYGYMKGMHCRDKDGVVISMLVAELMAVCKDKGTTVFEYMENIYNKYGIFEQNTVSQRFEGIEGVATMKKIMEDARSIQRDEIAGIKVVEFADYDSGIIKNQVDGSERPTNLPKSNVLKYFLEDGGFVAMRPSGTEPLIKYYIDAKGNTKEEAKNKLENLQKVFIK